jgi:hypothetical protein
VYRNLDVYIKEIQHMSLDVFLRNNTLLLPKSKCIPNANQMYTIYKVYNSAKDVGGEGGGKSKNVRHLFQCFFF